MHGGRRGMFFQVKHLNKSYGKKRVLQDLSWDIEEGKVYGLIGSNGAGKSTLLRTIAGVLEADAGLILMDGQSFPLQGIEKRGIAFLSDEPYFLPKATLPQMKTFYKSFHPDFSEESFQKLCEIFQLDHKLSINQMSKGQKRQAALILQMSTRPRLLLMDESFDGLDPRMRLSLKRFLADLILEDKISIVISSHNIRELEDICDAMALLEGGRICFTRTMQELQEDYHKIQVGFSRDITEADFAHLPLLSVRVTGRVATILYKGDLKEIKASLESMQPVLNCPIPLNMEEIFVAEMEEVLNENA